MKTESQLPDPDWFKALKEGSTRIFREVVEQNQNQVFSIVSKYEKDRNKVEDMAQETFIRAWKNLDRFDGRSPIQHWISKIAVRISLDHLKHEQRLKKEVLFSSLGDSALEWFRCPHSDESASGAAAREILDYGLRQLSPEDRLVITLLEIENREVREISELTGWSKITVKVRAFRARAKLRKVLTQLEKHERR